MQKTQSIKPLFIDADISYEDMPVNKSPFIKGLTFDVNSNPVNNIGTSNPIGSGQNQLMQSTVRSNVPVMNVKLPDGFNKHIGSFESITTQELYHCNFNINGNHGIYVLDGNSGVWNTVIIDSGLQFTDDQENYIANHRFILRFVKDKNGNIVEKYLLISEGGSWQKYINVIAAIQTNGFNQALYPYWTLQPPHFDRRELLEWPTRPPMQKAIITYLPNTDADLGKINRFVDTGIQVAYSYQNTDGRTTTLSPFSLPILIKSEDYLNNPDSLPKNVSALMQAGSPLTEKILVYIRTAKSNSNTLPSIQEWGDWFLYDTLKKFPDSNTGNVLGSQYWLRTNQWSNYSYDNIFNTIQYSLDLSKVPQIINQEQANMIQTAMPQINVALTDIGDAALLSNVRYGYPNFGVDVMDNISVNVQEKENTSCPIPLRTITLYAYIGSPFDTDQWASQVGFYNDDTKAMLFGGLKIGGSNMVDIDINVTSAFNLNFGDKKALRCYLKGTPYYADGQWYQVNSDNSLVKLPQLLDIRDPSVKEFIQNVYVSQGYFVCVFEITAPAGRYIATLGRHNVDSSGDYRNTSTYIYGIANSRMKSTTFVAIGVPVITSIKPNAINNNNGILYSKEMEVDCTSADVDVWGNGSDLFYVYCPYLTNNKQWRFTEGYFRESVPPTNGTSLAVEMFPYRMNHNVTNDCGQFTDKNGFYWSYTNNLVAPTVDVQMVVKLNCAYPTIFNIPTSSSGAGWKQNTDNYLSQFNGGVVGNANRILYTGKVSSIDGTLTYANVAISIKDGATVYSRSDGTFTLIVHNGMNVLRVSNVYVNAGGNFFITIANCGQIPLYNFTEPSCNGDAVRNYYPNLDLFLNISTDQQTSLKEAGKYSVGVYGADLAGRVMFVNVQTEINIPSFLQRNDLNATYLQVLLNSSLDLSAYPDMKWLILCVSKNLAVKRYLQWVGDEIDYIDNNGQQVTDPSSAVFCSIKINSLFNSNVAKNFSLLSSYQFVAGDRVRVLDNGEGQLFDISDYGEPIDLQILGTNYLQAAMSAGLLPPETNTVLSTAPTSPDVTLIVRYDPRLDSIINKTGFWIEIYTPTQQSDVIPFYEDKIFPIIKGKPAIFTGYSNGQPVYTYPSVIDLNFWDTYFFDRSITIPNVGNKYFSHPFESQNVTDNWGANLISGGRNNIKNDNAKQYWLPGGTIKSDDFLKEGIINGLGTFREENKKDFGSYPFGGIVATHSERNIIHFSCENDWFVTDYNYHYAYPNEQGFIVANLDNGLSTPHQKIGSQFGLSMEDTGTYIPYDKHIYWYDRKNTAYVRMNFREAIDVSIRSDSEQGGMQAYFNTKTDFIAQWNNVNTQQNMFDVVAGIDVELGKLYLTFRCRRNNSQDVSSFINDRRDWQLNFQETIVYDTINRGFLRSEGFAPEGYATLRGNAFGTQLISFASGLPYLHSSEGVTFNNYYGVQTTPVMIVVFNESRAGVKVFDAVFYAGNPSGWFIHKMYTDFKNSFTYLSENQFRKILNIYYAAIMRNMNSYPSNKPEDIFRNMLFDGYCMRGKYMIATLVGDYESEGQYKELGNVTTTYSIDESNVK